MLSSTPSHKFLLDENVRIELFRFLKRKGIDVRLPPKSAPDSKVALISNREKRVLVTNDEGFTHYTRDEIFAVIWLRIPQNDSMSLINSFEKLLKGYKDFSGKLVVLKSGSWEEFPLNDRGD